MDSSSLLALIGWSSLLLFTLVLPGFIRGIRRYCILLRVPAASPGRWILGQLNEIQNRRNVVERWQKWLCVHPRISRIRFGHYLSVNLYHPDTASVLFKTAQPKEKSYRFLEPWLGKGLIVSSGKRWARDRRLLTRGFHFDILRHYVEIYHEAVDVMLKQWTYRCEQSECCTVNVTQSCTLLTLDVILRCIMSYHSDCQDPRSTGQAIAYANAVKEVAHCITTRMLSLFEHNDLVFKLSANGRRFYKLRSVCHEVSQRLITERREKLNERCDCSSGTREHTVPGRRKYFDLLDILLMVRDEDGSGLSDEEIQEQVDTFLFAGHDTTASALQWTVYQLAKHPSLQDKCRTEVKKVIGDKRQFTYEELNHLTYLSQFIKESIRLSPTVPFVHRSLADDFVVDGYTLPAGSSVTLNILALHHNPTVWEDPLRFDPERFTAENTEKRSPFAFVPFSAGPRNCIGQSLAFDELKTVIAAILMKYHLSENTTHPMPHYQASMIGRSFNDIHIDIHPLSE